MTVPNFMIVPSLACQAACKYCFGPHKGAVMDERTARETVRFIQSIAAETSARNLNITFHGGEPLLAPVNVWEVMLNEIQTRLQTYRLNLNMQSNLWNLDDRYLQLLREHHVSIGTSLDGPPEICDMNRGKGYFARTWASVKKANASGCSVSAIATVSRQTLPHVQDIAKYFRNNSMPLVLHGVVAGMDAAEAPCALTPAEYAGMIKELFPWYVKNRKNIKIDTLDYFARGIVTGNPGVCTFRDCLGMFLAISPTGDITSCQRLAGKEAFCMGNIFDRPSLAALYESTAAKKQKERERLVGRRCGECEIYPICKGGCYYSAIACGDGIIDPLCEAYKEIYDFVQEKVFDEMQSAENIDAIAARPAMDDEHPLLRKGAYISLSKDAHPAHIADNARRILAIYELGRTNNPVEAAQNLFEQKICGNVALTASLLGKMQEELKKNHKTKNNCYIHVTFNCNLRCSHCYAEAGESSEEMDLRQFETVVREAIENRFRQIIITGGEPMVHSQRDKMLETAKKYRGRGTNLVLRTNLTGCFAEKDFTALSESFDQVVVSIDGNEHTHDTRRGAGSYRNAVHNLETYTRVNATASNAAELSLACVLCADDINGEPGTNVRELARKLGVKRIRFRPLLPLGRAAKTDEPVMCEGLMEHVSPDEMLQSAMRPLTTCGIGQNLFVRPNGDCYPCYAWCGDHTYIGNLFEHGLQAILSSPQFRRLEECTVDTISTCRNCSSRYLCGGACRAWGNQQELNLNASPANCEHLKKRAEKLIAAALEYVTPKK